VGCRVPPVCACSYLPVVGGHALWTTPNTADTSKTGSTQIQSASHERAGEKLFVDFCGQTMPVTDPRTGEMRQVQIFVAVLAHCDRVADWRLAENR
jgi:hypothetical protein